MYPYQLITFPDGSGITLYEILILVGVIGALVLFRILADKTVFGMGDPLMLRVPGVMSCADMWMKQP